MENLVLVGFKMTKKNFELFQNYARYCSKYHTNTNSIIYAQSSEKISSFNDKDEIIELSAQEVINLSDNFFKINQKRKIIDSN